MNAIPHASEFRTGTRPIPRFREAGDVTLDLVHRDGRIEASWLGLKPREFALLWRLAEQPGARVTGNRLLAEERAIAFVPERDSLAVVVAGVRARLEPFGLAHLIAAHHEGGYVLDAPESQDWYGIAAVIAG